MFAEANPKAKWEPDFKDHNGGIDYKIIRKQIVDDQGGLCAYCEEKIFDLPPFKQRVEHFHSKSDSDDPIKNWALDWENVLGVCIGGEDSDKSLHPLPENLSCDAHKNHLINKNKIPEACEGVLLNPLTIIASPCLFEFDKASGKLIPNAIHCGETDVSGSQLELVKSTIDILNLNCDRLVQQRLLLLRKYNRLVADARKRNDKEFFPKIAEKWFRSKWLFFFTTRRILLGKHAETYLKHIGYNG